LPLRVICFGAGIKLLLIAMEEEGVEHPAAEGIDVFLALGDGAPRDSVARWLAELPRSRGAAETDYAGRSLKGQLTHARRLGAAHIVVVGSDTASLRQPGREDEPIEHAEIVSRLSAGAG